MQLMQQSPRRARRIAATVMGGGAPGRAAPQHDSPGTLHSSLRAEAMRARSAGSSAPAPSSARRCSAWMPAEARKGGSEALNT